MEAPLDPVDAVPNLSALRIVRGQQRDRLRGYFRWLEAAKRGGDRRREATFLGLIGGAFHSVGRNEVALVYYVGALAAFREVGARREEGVTLSNMASVLDDLGWLRDALDINRQARDISRELGDRAAEGLDLDRIGSVLLDLGLAEEALEHHREALEIAREERGGSAERQALTNMGSALHRLKRNEEAHRCYQEALVVCRKEKEHQGVAACLLNIGNVIDARGRHAEAIDHYERALEITRGLEDRQAGAVCLVNIAGSLESLERYEEALDRYRQALAEFRAISDLRGEGAALRGVGDCFARVGRLEEAYRCHARCLSIARQTGDRARMYDALADLAPLAYSLGRPQEALEQHRQALELARWSGDRKGEAVQLGSISALMEDLGRGDEGQGDSEGTLALAREMGDREGEASLLTHLGARYLRSGFPEKALAFHREALEIAKDEGIRGVQAACMKGISEVLQVEGRPAEALDLLDQALGIVRELKEAEFEAVGLSMRGLLLRDLGRSDEAVGALRRALELVTASGNRRGEQEVLVNLARLYTFRREFEQAESCFERAIELIESYRDQLDDGEDRISFFSTRAAVYGSYLALLSFRGHEEEDEGKSLELAEKAFNCAERIRARALVEMLVRLRMSASEEYGRRYREAVSARVAAAAARDELLGELTAVEYEADLETVRRSEVDAVRARLEEAEAALSLSLERADAIEAEAGLSDPGLAALANGRDSIHLEDARQQLLDDDTVLLEYTFAEGFCFVFCLTTEGIGQFILEGRQEVERMVRELRVAVAHGWEHGLRFYPHGHRLYEMLVAPMAELVDGKGKLLIVADGQLSHLPFSLLLEGDPDGGEALASQLGDEAEGAAGDAEIVARLKREQESRGASFDWGRLPYLLRGRSIRYLASASAAATAQRDRALQGEGAPTLCAYGAPLARRAGDASEREFPPLRWVESELGALREVWERGDLEPTIEPKADRDTVLSRSGQPHAVCHFACHCRVDDDVPEASGLVLEPVGSDPSPSFLGAGEILSSSIPCELAVLSACDTGRGKLVRGEGVLALSRAFMVAGARSVCASLWTVYDPAAPVLMRALYSNLLTAGRDREAALSMAQLQMLDGPYAHPYFWAGFSLWGSGGPLAG